jgi:hypothetical protein
MSYTSADLENVERAIISLSTGRRSAKFVIDGNVVEYSTVELPQLRSVRSEIISELAAAVTDGTAVTAFVIAGGKGL